MTFLIQSLPFYWILYFLHTSVLFYYGLWHVYHKYFYIDVFGDWTIPLCLTLFLRALLWFRYGLLFCLFRLITCDRRCDSFLFRVFTLCLSIYFRRFLATLPCVTSHMFWVISCGVLTKVYWKETFSKKILPNCLFLPNIINNQKFDEHTMV